MAYRFGKLWHLAIIWAIRKAFQCIPQGVRFLLAKQTQLSPTSANESYSDLSKILTGIPGGQGGRQEGPKELRGTSRGTQGAQGASRRSQGAKRKVKRVPED